MVALNKNTTDGTDKFVTTYYVRDPQGIVMAVYEHKHGDSDNGTFTLTEQHLYGAGRLGMRKRDLALNTGNANESPATYYELTNHLGNVMAVISDEASTTDKPTIVSFSDYYPFGMTEPGRSWNAGDYRFGYTGHEKENDLAEGVYTTEYRLLDTRLGRWLSADPLAGKYPGMSSYNYCGGNPLVFIDSDGRKLIFANEEVQVRFMSYICRINDKSLLRDYEQLESSSIPYHVEYVSNIVDQFGVGYEVRGVVYPTYYNKADKLTEKNSDGSPFAFFQFNAEEAGLTLNSGHYSGIVPFFHELRHAALFDALVRYIDLGEDVSLDLIDDAICKYNNMETHAEKQISIESIKEEGLTGGEIYVLYFGAQTPADTPTELQAIEQECKIAIDQSELKEGEVTRYSYDRYKDRKIRDEKNNSK